MLFPGTCCYWKTNFGHTFENLQKYFYVMVVSYSGFDETENTTFISELDEVKKVEDYIQSQLDGKLFAAYGCSLGGSFVSLLVNRQKIHIDLIFASLILGMRNCCWMLNDGPMRFAEFVTLLSKL